MVTWSSLDIFHGYRGRFLGQGTKFESLSATCPPRLVCTSTCTQSWTMVVINTLNYWKVCKLLLKNFSRLIERCKLDLRSSTCTQSWTMVVINILDHRKAHKLRQSQDFRCRDSIETRLELAIHRLGASQSSCPRTGLAKIRPTSTSRSSMHRTIGRCPSKLFW